MSADDERDYVEEQCNARTEQFDDELARLEDAAMRPPDRVAEQMNRDDTAPPLCVHETSEGPCCCSEPRDEGCPPLPRRVHKGR